MKKRFKKVRSPGSGALSNVRHFFPNVEKVEDASKPVIVEVTHADVAKSNVKDHRTCALAVACTRSFNADGVIIGLTTSYIIKGKIAVRFHNADTISREITSFDRKAGFDVGFYHLSPASPGSRLSDGEYHATKVKNPKSRSYTPNMRHYTKGVRTTLGRIS